MRLKIDWPPFLKASLLLILTWLIAWLEWYVPSVGLLSIGQVLLKLIGWHVVNFWITAGVLDTLVLITLAVSFQLKQSEKVLKTQPIDDDDLNKICHGLNKPYQIDFLTLTMADVSFPNMLVDRSATGVVVVITKPLLEMSSSLVIKTLLQRRLVLIQSGYFKLQHAFAITKALILPVPNFDWQWTEPVETKTSIQRQTAEILLLMQRKVQPAWLSSNWLVLTKGARS